MQLMQYGSYHYLVSKAYLGMRKKKYSLQVLPQMIREGTDGQVLWQLMLYHVKHLYHDVADTPGKRLFFSIDGGPGRLDIHMLAELRSLGVCICFLEFKIQPR
jgi:hypothetical protein